MKKLFYLLTIPLFFLYPTVNSEPGDLRIISLAPNTTEILFALGLENNIVGVDTFSNYPTEARKIKKVGSFSQPNVEKILYLKPDLVFTTGLEQTPAVARLKRFGFKVITIDPIDTEELLKEILKVGKLTDRKEEAEALVNSMQDEISRIKNAISVIPQASRPKVYLEIWHSPIMTCGKGSYLDELISLAGGINIAQDAPRQFSRFSEELIINRSPDIIILCYMQAGKVLDKIYGRYGWQNINAVKTGRVYNDINPDILLRPGPRVIEALRSLEKHFSIYGKNLAKK
ncbi:MAG: cobalamin-binding protein [Candidatus Omnitrophica bacterium]|nr:cobalamin-binding protein [Candidatus Omnitrophota bacterium]